jgi:D-alanyl-D-alanine dipeptidase
VTDLHSAKRLETAKSPERRLLGQPRGAFENLHAELSRGLAHEPQLSHQIESMLVPPSIAQRSELNRLLERLCVSLPLRPVALPERVLNQPLSPELKSLVDLALEARYAKAIERDESPRDSFEFRECGERMIDLQLAAREAGLIVKWSTLPFNPACGPVYGGAPRIFWARESVALKFMQAAKALNEVGFAAQVEDGFRPLDVQQGLFQRRFRMIRESQPNLPEADLLSATYAKTAAAPYRAAHMGGAAIDYTIWRLGRFYGEVEDVPLELGNEYPGGGAATYLDFPYLTWDQFVTRAVFRSVSEAAGLTVYPGEDWHVSAGDSQAALMSGETVVRFCAIRDFDRKTGEIQPYSRDDLVKFFVPEGQN